MDKRVLNLGEWVTSDKTAKRNKEPWFRKRVSEGLKKHFALNPRKNEAWYIKKYGKNYVPKKLKHSADWKALSKRLRSEIGSCSRCFSKEKLDVHHMIPFVITKDNSLENLVVLCSSCHKIVEDESWKIKNINFKWEDVRFLVNNELCAKRQMMRDV